MSFEPNSHQQALLEAVWASHQNRATPGTVEAKVVAALATCKPSLLRMTDFSSPADAWRSLDPTAREVVNYWWQRPPQPPEASFWETSPARSSEELAELLRDPISLRRARSETQTVFWPRFGVTQSAGARYESHGRLPPPIRLLLALFASGQITDEQLRRLKRLASSRATNPTTSERQVIECLANPARARHERGESQQIFWKRLGSEQGQGCRYEQGRALPTPIAMLLAGFLSGEISGATLGAMYVVVNAYVKSGRLDDAAEPSTKSD